MTKEFLQNIFTVAGGLGLFLFGMKLMSDGLKKIAGKELKNLLDKATSNHLIGILVGIIVTAIVQSSSATTIMVVGFINAGLLNLMQGMGVILGANIGTTLSAQIIAFRIDSIAPFFIFIGSILYIFFKKDHLRNFGYLILGFGILFFGISVMGIPMAELAKDPDFQTSIINFNNPFLAFLTGLIFTAIVQSSSVTIGILITMYLSNISFPFEIAAFIILGSNIGTCIDTLIASIPANQESKQAAIAHFLYNIITCSIFAIFIFIFPSILSWFQNIWIDKARGIAMFHTFFNIIALLLFVPFIKPYTTFILKITSKK